MIDDDDESGYEKKARAGLIPFIKNDTGEYQYLMMVSSDPKFGGPRPMISKGKIEEGEDELGAAIREAEEELGLCMWNTRGEVFEIFRGRTVLRSGAYDLTVYAVEVIDRSKFVMWCDETLYIEWHTLASFKEEGRRDHLRFVETLDGLLQTRI